MLTHTLVGKWTSHAFGHVTPHKGFSEPGKPLAYTIILKILWNYKACQVQKQVVYTSFVCCILNV